MPWDPARCQCTRAYEEWSYVEPDIRQFLGLTSRFVAEAYSRIVEEVARQPAFPDDGPDEADLFYDRVGGLWPVDHEWMLCAATLRDAVTAFEVYVATAVDEVSAEKGLPRVARRDGGTSGWNALGDYCVRFLGTHGPVTPEVRRLLDLRNLLTHQRGELRTDADHQRFSAPEGVFPEDRAHLSPADVLAACDTLAAVVRRIDAELWGDRPVLAPPEGLEDLLRR